VDTNLNERDGNDAESVNLMGRMFIAMLEDIASRRRTLDRDTLKPVWIYLDEASDYLSNDKTFIQILTKAAEQKVGLTVAYQYEGQDGVDPSIEKALRNASIHSRCLKRGLVELTINGEPLTLHPRKFEFTRDEPQMDTKEYDALRERLAAAFPYKEPPPQSPKNGPAAGVEKGVTRNY
jgi:hypothetical protein